MSKTYAKPSHADKRVDILKNIYNFLLIFILLIDSDWQSYII